MLDRLVNPAATVAEAIDRATETMTVAEMGDQLAGAEATIEHLTESLADLQLALEDVGWQRIGLFGDQQFTREGLATAARLTRVMAVANPLIRRGLSLRTAYVWGGGVEIAARATGPTDDNAAVQDVNAVVQAFLDDKATRKVLTGATAQQRNERTLGTDGNLFIACFTLPRTGRVQPRVLPFDQITDRICNPDDAAEVWFYKRTWSTPDGQTHTAYYPDIDYRPRNRIIRFRDAALGELTLTAGDVEWDAPVIHLKVNDLDGWDFGIGDAYAAIAWARAYKEFLEDWAKLVKALSRFAWRATSDRKSKAQTAAARAAKTASTNSATGEPNDVGAFVSMGPGQSLEAIPKTGATIDSESGKPLAGLVAAAMDVPLTMLLADPGQTGARAVAETLDRPTELMAGMRRDVWADFFTQILGYVIDQAVKAPAGPLQGIVGRDDWGREVVELAGDTPRTIDITWPDLSETDIKTLMEALEIADGLGKLPDLLIVQLVLTALGVDDADEWLEKVTDEDGNFVPPETSAGQVAVDRARRGEDPADVL